MDLKDYWLACLFYLLDDGGPVNRRVKRELEMALHSAILHPDTADMEIIRPALHFLDEIKDAAVIERMPAGVIRDMSDITDKPHVRQIADEPEVSRRVYHRCLGMLILNAKLELRIVRVDEITQANESFPAEATVNRIKMHHQIPEARAGPHDPRDQLVKPLRLPEIISGLCRHVH